MNRVIAYSDRWSVAPGETLRFFVSCLGGNDYTAHIVRLKQPEAGPLATPFAPGPARCALHRPARRPLPADPDRLACGRAGASGARRAGQLHADGLCVPYD